MPKSTPDDRAALVEAYRAAKAKHDALILDLKRATTKRAPPDPDLLRRQAQAAMEEFAALAALRGAAAKFERQ